MSHDYDPPADPYGNEPTRGECVICHETKDYGDMTTCGVFKKEICRDCIDEALANFPAEAHGEIEYIIKKYATVDIQEIKILGEP